MKLGSETASVTNWMMAGVKNPQPVPGMGATMLCWTDRHPGTVISVTSKTLRIQLDRAIRVDKNGMSECQEYRYEPDIRERVITFRLTKRGWREQGGGASLLLGTREKYHDFSF